MPLYEYSCTRCEQDFEALLFPGEKTEDVECPSCQGHEVKRKVSATAAPKTTSLSLGGACNTNLPPCGPGCCRVGS